MFFLSLKFLLLFYKLQEKGKGKNETGRVAHSIKNGHEVKFAQASESRPKGKIRLAFPT
jgi:hypothetical protein